MNTWEWMDFDLAGERWQIALECPTWAHTARDNAPHHLAKAGILWNSNLMGFFRRHPDAPGPLAFYVPEPKTADTRHETIVNGMLVQRETKAPTFKTPPGYCPDGLELYPFQVHGADWVKTHKRCLIADDMGLGKSPQSLTGLNLTGFKRLLVLCPASIKINWKREAQRWMLRPVTVDVIDGKPTLKTAADITVCNYDITTKQTVLDWLLAQEFDCLIIDEAHYLKNPQAKRTKAAKLLAKKPARVIALTGTPIQNRPIDLWPILQMLDPGRWTNWIYYIKRYCDAKQGKFGWDTSGSSNLDELQSILRNTIMIRRLKSDVLKDLPAKIRQVLVLPCPSDIEAAIADERITFERSQATIDYLKAEAEKAQKTQDQKQFAAVIEQLKSAHEIQFQDMSRVRSRTAFLKAPIVADYINDKLEESDEPVVIFAHHKAVIEELEKKLGKWGVVKVVGGMSTEQKQAAVDAFQSGRARVFIGNIMAAGVGLTLTKAAWACFAELDWVPGNNAQAEDRIHRITQTRQVTIQILVLEGSIDERVARTNIYKQDVITQALDTQALP